MHSLVRISDTNSSGCQANPERLEGTVSRKAEAPSSISELMLAWSGVGMAPNSTSCSAWSRALDRSCWRNTVGSLVASLWVAGRASSVERFEGSVEGSAGNITFPDVGRVDLTTGLLTLKPRGDIGSMGVRSSAAQAEAGQGL